jgi:hypothetical protein
MLQLHRLERVTDHNIQVNTHLRLPQLGAFLRRVPVHDWPQWNETRWIDFVMRHVVMPLDVVEVDGIRHSRYLVDVAGVGPEVRVIYQTAQVALEMHVVDGIEAEQRREEANIGLSQLGAQQVAPRRQPFLQPIEPREECSYRRLIGGLGHRESRPVDAVIDFVIDDIVDLVYLWAQIFGVEVGRVGLLESAEVQYLHRIESTRYAASWYLSSPLPPGLPPNCYHLACLLTNSKRSVRMK